MADTQGAEGDLISGGQATLARTRYLYLEYSTRIPKPTKASGDAAELFGDQAISQRRFVEEHAHMIPLPKHVRDVAWVHREPDDV